MYDKIDTTYKYYGVLIGSMVPTISKICGVIFDKTVFKWLIYI